jgi:hypothetical protein
MSKHGERSAERRWIVVANDGRFVTLGRDSDPCEQEILKAEQDLVSQGLAGWLAIMQGNPFVGAEPHIMMVRPLGNPSTTFEDAAHACVSNIMDRRSQIGNIGLRP